MPRQERLCVLDDKTIKGLHMESFSQLEIKEPGEIRPALFRFYSILKYGVFVEGICQKITTIDIAFSVPIIEY